MAQSETTQELEIPSLWQLISPLWLDRHTFATWAIRANAREIDVQSLLGHSSLAMVQRHARTYSSEQAVQAHAGSNATS